VQMCWRTVTRRMTLSCATADSDAALLWYLDAATICYGYLETIRLLTVSISSTTSQGQWWVVKRGVEGALDKSRAPGQPQAHLHEAARCLY